MPNQTVGDLLGAIERIGPLTPNTPPPARPTGSFPVRSINLQVYGWVPMKRLCGAGPAGAINTREVAPCTGASRLMPPCGA